MTRVEWHPWPGTEWPSDDEYVLVTTSTSEVEPKRIVVVRQYLFNGHFRLEQQYSPVLAWAHMPEPMEGNEHNG